MCYFLDFPFHPDSDEYKYKEAYFALESKAHPWRVRIVMEAFPYCTIWAKPMQVPVEEEHVPVEEEEAMRWTRCRGCW